MARDPDIATAGSSAAVPKLIPSHQTHVSQLNESMSAAGSSRQRGGRRPPARTPASASRHAEPAPLVTLGLFTPADAAETLALPAAAHVRLPGARRSRVASQRRGGRHTGQLPPGAVLPAADEECHETCADGVVFGAFPAARAAVKEPAPPTLPAPARQPAPSAWAAVARSKPHSPATVGLRARGLVNTGNQCFAHAVLQSLAAARPVVSALREECGRAPVGAAGVLGRFLDEYATGMEGDLTPTPLAPSYVFELLRSRGFTNQGRQEDAEEFLGFLLDAVHEDLAAAGVSSAPSEGRLDEGEWEEVGRGHRTATRRVAGVAASSRASATAVDRFFGGRIRSVVRRQGMRDSITTQPFRVLPLDIQADGIATVEDALLRLCAEEELGGVVDERSGAEVAASRTQALEALPRALVLHLKRFTYDARGSAPKKFSRHICYRESLSVPDAVLAPAVRNADEAQRAYRLCAVVRHRGQSLSGGHYVCDVRYGDEWVRCDDMSVKRIPSRDALGEDGGAAYLLFYLRKDEVASSA